MVDMSVKIGSVTLKNPIMPASGCFSTDLAQVIDLNRLGALVAKTVSREFRAGNPPPRASEVEGGMISSPIGGDVAHCSRAEMLIALSGVVPCGVRHADPTTRGGKEYCCRRPGPDRARTGCSWVRRAPSG